MSADTDKLIESQAPLEWLIRKDGYFYRPGKAGYTTVKAEAGRYAEWDARREAEIEPWHMSAIHQDDVPDPENYDTGRIKELADCNLALIDRIASLEAERDDARRQRDEIGRAWDEADARAKEAEARAASLEAALAPFAALAEASDRLAAEGQRHLQPEASAGLTNSEIATLVFPDDQVVATDGRMAFGHKQHPSPPAKITMGDLRRAAALSSSKQKDGE